MAGSLNELTKDVPSPVGSGRYQIVNRGSGTALDGAGNTTVGSTTILWTPNSSTNNEWTITAV